MVRARCSRAASLHSSGGSTAPGAIAFTVMSGASARASVLVSITTPALLDAVRRVLRPRLQSADIRQVDDPALGHPEEGQRALGT